MAFIALKDSTITETTASNHITYKVYEYQGESPPYCVSWDKDGNCTRTKTDSIYDWVNKTTSAKVTGKVSSTVTNVLVQGKAPIVQGDKTSEKDTYNLPSGGVYVSGSHTSGQGSVTSGNSNNVFINGKSVAIKGSKVTTHAQTNSTINDGVSSTVNIG